MNTLANVAGYQLMWLAAIWGAGHGLWWPGLLAAVPFAAWVLARPGALVDLKLMAFVVPLGCLMDSILAAGGLLHYAAPVPSTHLAPAWIASIWCCFALTLRHTFRFLMGRPWRAAVFGALGAPLAYLGAARGWQAVAFAHGTTPALAALAAMWALAMPLMLQLAVALENHRSPLKIHGDAHA